MGVSPAPPSIVPPVSLEISLTVNVTKKSSSSPRRASGTPAARMRMQELKLLLLRGRGAGVRCGSARVLRPVLVQRGDDVVAEVEAVLGVNEDRHAVEAGTGAVEHDVELVALHAFLDQLGDFIDDAIAHPDGLFLE